MSLAAYSKTREETKKLKKESLSKKAEREDLESSQVFNLAKNEKVCSGGNTKGVAGSSVHKNTPHSSHQSGMRTDVARYSRDTAHLDHNKRLGEDEDRLQTSGILWMGQQNYLAVNKIREE